MTPSILQNVLWALSCIGQATVVVVILSRGAARRWPFLLALNVFDVLYSLVLFAILSHYATYFYIYWAGQGVRSLISIGLLHDVMKSLPALKFLPRRIGLAMSCFASVVTGGAVYLAYIHPSQTYRIVAEALTIQQCATVAWAALAVCLLGCISFLGLGWGLEALNITSGFIVSGLAALIAAALTSSWPKQGHVIDLFHICTDLLVLSYWIHSLCRPSLCPDCSNSDNALASLNQLCKESLLV